MANKLQYFGAAAVALSLSCSVSLAEEQPAPAMERAEEMKEMRGGSAMDAVAPRLELRRRMHREAPKTGASVMQQKSIAQTGAIEESETLRYVSDASGEELKKMLGRTLGDLIPTSSIEKVMLPFGAESLTDSRLERLLLNATIVEQKSMREPKQAVRCPVVIVTGNNALFKLNLFECAGSSGTLVTPQAKRYWFSLSEP